MTQLPVAEYSRTMPLFNSQQMMMRRQKKNKNHIIGSLRGEFDEMTRTRTRGGNRNDEALLLFLGIGRISVSLRMCQMGFFLNIHLLNGLSRLKHLDKRVAQQAVGGPMDDLP